MYGPHSFRRYLRDGFHEGWLGVVITRGASGAQQVVSVSLSSRTQLQAGPQGELARVAPQLQVRIGLDRPLAPRDQRLAGQCAGLCATLDTSLAAQQTASVLASPSGILKLTQRGLPAALADISCVGDRVASKDASWQS